MKCDVDILVNCTFMSCVARWHNHVPVDLGVHNDGIDCVASIRNEDQGVCLTNVKAPSMD